MRNHVIDPQMTNETAPASVPGPLLQVRDLTVAYGDGSQALTDVSLEAAEGSIVAVLGSNGAGKSTLLRAISGGLALEGGRICSGSLMLRTIDLAALATVDRVRAGVVQVPEGRQVFKDLTVEENLRTGGLSRPRAARQAGRDRAFELFPRLAERRTQKAGLLSGGEQQMLAIGRALMAEPEVLLLDEPSLGLAPQVVDQIAEIVREINKQGTTVVLVEQNAGMALHIAGHAVVLEVGRVALEGPAAELAASDEVRERYLGISTHATSARARAPRGTTDRDVSALHAEGLTVRFGGIVALSDVSLTIEPGETHAIIGPNGAGKSTCLNVLTGVYRATEGQVRYGEQVINKLRPHRIAQLGISRTFQNIALSPEATVEANMILGRHRKSKAGFVSSALQIPSARSEQAKQREVIRVVAGHIGLTEYLDRPVHELAYGDRKRVELARAAASYPSVLLLDEPVAGMNATESAQMAETIATLRELMGLSVVLIEHDMPFVMSLADRVTVLDFGRCIAQGTPDEIQRDPEVLRAYLGTTDINGGSS